MFATSHSHPPRDTQHRKVWWGGSTSLPTKNILQKKITSGLLALNAAPVESQAHRCAAPETAEAADGEEASVAFGLRLSAVARGPPLRWRFR